jgi:hypothetical protein
MRAAHVHVRFVCFCLLCCIVRRVATLLTCVKHFASRTEDLSIRSRFSERRTGDHLNESRAQVVRKVISKKQPLISTRELVFNLLLILTSVAGSVAGAWYAVVRNDMSCDSVLTRLERICALRLMSIAPPHWLKLTIYRGCNHRYYYPSSPDRLVNLTL